MTTYALVRPDDSVDRVQSNIDPTVATKPGWAWLPLQVDDQPTFNAGLETVTLGPPVKSGNAVVRSWTKTRKPLEQQKAAVKTEAQRRIYARYPQWKQANMTARGVELQDLWRRNGGWTAEESAEAASLQTAWDAIRAIRAASDALEAMDPLPLDYASDSYWPGA